MTDGLLDLAADDLLSAAAGFALERLPESVRDRIAFVVALGPSGPSIELWEARAGGLVPVGCVARLDEPARDLVDSAGILATSWLNALPVETRRLIADTQTRGAVALVAADPGAGVLSLALRHGSQVVEIARREVRACLH